MSSSSKATPKKGQRASAHSSRAGQPEPAEKPAVAGSRLGVIRALQADPEQLEEQVMQEQQAARPVTEAAESTARVFSEPTAQAAGRVSQVAAAPAVAVVGESPDSDEPGVERVGSDLFVRDDNGRLIPVDALTKMTFSFTALERHRLRRYAEAHQMDYVEVIRQRLADIFDRSTK